MTTHQSVEQKLKCRPKKPLRSISPPKQFTKENSCNTSYIQNPPNYEITMYLNLQVLAYNEGRANYTICNTLSMWPMSLI